MQLIIVEGWEGVVQCPLLWMGLWASYSVLKSNMSCPHFVFSVSPKDWCSAGCIFHFSLPGNVLFTCYTWCDKLCWSNPTYKILQALMCVLESCLPQWMSVMGVFGKASDIYQGTWKVWQ